MKTAQKGFTSMEATEQEVSEVWNWLKNAQHVVVNEDWLEACISWLKQKETNERVELRDQVYEQWLLSDLSESGSGCLPANILTIAKTEIQGFLALQINFIVNVGESAYSQWMKLKGESRDHTPDAEPKAQFWEPKPTRMLMLALTDGQQNIQGMEYKPIKDLHSGLAPGTKILIKGNAECKKGIIFLTEENIKILGGQVEHLMEENSQMNVLHQVLMKSKKPEEGAVSMTQSVGQDNQMLNNVRESGYGSSTYSDKENQQQNIENPNRQWNQNLPSSSNIASSNQNTTQSDATTNPVCRIAPMVSNKKQINTQTMAWNQNTGTDKMIADEDLAEFWDNDDEDFLLADLNSGVNTEQDKTPFEIDGFRDEMDDVVDDLILSGLDEREIIELEQRKKHEKELAEEESNHSLFEFTDDEELDWSNLDM